MTNPDTQRPARKEREAKGRRTGRPAAGFDETLVVTGGRLTMPGFSPRDGVFEWLNDDEVIRTKGFSAYDQMRHDDMVKCALAMKRSLVAGRRYDVKPASDSEQDKQVAKFVTDQLNEIGFNKVMKEACSAFTWGYSLAEIVWKWTEFDGKPAIGLGKVAFRDPRQLRLFTTLHGDFTQVRQEPDHGYTNYIDLPVDRLFHYPYQGEFGNPYGVSDLRSVYKNWWAKKFTIQFWNVFLERLGQPLLAVKYPQGAPEELKNNIKKILKGLSTKTEIMIPDGVVFELIEAQRSGNGDYLGALNYHDVAIAKGILVPALLGFTAGNPARGSDSQSRLHLRTLFKLTGDISDEITAVFAKQVIRKMVDYNFDVTAYPKIVWGDFSEYEAFEITDGIRLLHAAGILEMDGVDVNYARSLLGLPIRDEENADEVIRPPEPPPPASANAPPPAAEQGNSRGTGKQDRSSGGSTGARGGRGAAAS